jgi:hypothetical protein
MKNKKKQKKVASTGDSAIPMTQWASNMCKHRGRFPICKNKINIRIHISGISDIKLKRTDTTLDLSQKAVQKFSLVIGLI